MTLLMLLIIYHWDTLMSPLWLQSLSIYQSVLIRSFHLRSKSLFSNLTRDCKCFDFISRTHIIETLTLRNRDFEENLKFRTANPEQVFWPPPSLFHTLTHFGVGQREWETGHPVSVRLRQQTETVCGEVVTCVSDMCVLCTITLYKFICMCVAVYATLFCIFTCFPAHKHLFNPLILWPWRVEESTIINLQSL